MSTKLKKKRNCFFKCGYRTKQDKIEAVYQSLQKKYTQLGKLVSDDEVLRGEDTIRLHVKPLSFSLFILSAFLFMRSKSLSNFKIFCFDPHLHQLFL